MHLDDLGWGPAWAGKLESWKNEHRESAPEPEENPEPGPRAERAFEPARVIREDRGRYLVASAAGEHGARLTGRFRHQAAAASDYPTTGDWVVVRGAGPGETNGAVDGDRPICAVLPRESLFVRKAVLAGDRTEEQTVAANIDTVFLVSGLDTEFNLRRIERYLAIAHDSGAMPVILLNKLDLDPQWYEKLRSTQRMAGTVPVHAISADSGEGLEPVRSYLEPRRTYAFLGSSGVGKSTIINAFLETGRQAVSAISDATRKGRHTTTARELIVIPGGGIVLDTPGMKVIGAWSDEGGVSRTFAEVEELAAQCRFRNCRHEAEPGCAVRAAIEAGQLDPARLRNYRRLNMEAAAIAKRKKEIAHLRRHMNLHRKAKGQA